MRDPDYTTPAGVSSEARSVAGENELNYRAALEWLAKGNFIVPKHPEEKRPLHKWKHRQDKFPNETELADYQRQGLFAHGVGCLTGALSNIVIIDTDSAEAEELLRQFSPLPPTRCVRSGSGRGYHYHFRHPGGYVKTAANPSIKVDIKGDGGFCVLPPTLHKSGGRYELVDDVEPAPLPPGLIEFLMKKEAEAKAAAKKAEGNPARSNVVPSAHNNSKPASDWVVVPQLPPYILAEAERLVDMLKFSVERGLIKMNDRQDWLRLGMALHHLAKVGGWPEADCRRVWDAFSQAAPEKFNPEDQEKTWASFSRGYGDRPITVSDRNAALGSFLTTSTKVLIALGL
jgi:Bifunctional DNA primase/polymerase, N-terminal/Primase C terminal 2 (PriCT-2)